MSSELFCQLLAKQMVSFDVLLKASVQMCWPHPTCKLVLEASTQFMMLGCPNDAMPAVTCAYSTLYINLYIGGVCGN